MTDHLRPCARRPPQAQQPAANARLAPVQALHGRLRVRVGGQDGPRLRVDVEGELDLDTLPVLLAALDRLLRTRGRVVTLALAGLRFADPYSLRGLQLARERAVRRGCRITVGSVSPAVDRVLALCERPHWSADWPGPTETG